MTVREGLRESHRDLVQRPGRAVPFRNYYPLQDPVSKTFKKKTRKEKNDFNKIVN